MTRIGNDGAAFVCCATLSVHRRAWARGDATLLVQSGGSVLYSNVLPKFCIYESELWLLLSHSLITFLLRLPCKYNVYRQNCHVKFWEVSNRNVNDVADFCLLCDIECTQESRRWGRRCDLACWEWWVNALFKCDNKILYVYLHSWSYLPIIFPSFMQVFCKQIMYICKTGSSISWDHN